MNVRYLRSRAVIYGMNCGFMFGAAIVSLSVDRSWRPTAVLAWCLIWAPPSLWICWVLRKDYLARLDSEKVMETSKNRV